MTNGRRAIARCNSLVYEHFRYATVLIVNVLWWKLRVKIYYKGVNTNDFAPIHRRRALKLGHASPATVFRPCRLTFQQIPQENLDSPLLKCLRHDIYQA